MGMARKTLTKAAIGDLKHDLSSSLDERDIVEFVVRKLQESPQFTTGQYPERSHFLRHVTSTEHKHYSHTWTCLSLRGCWSAVQWWK